MKKIASFTVDHTVLKPGIYVSRIDGDCVTYDLRVKRPNVQPVMENDALHTIEHLFATYARNSEIADSVIYFGPMGCRTGFYFIVRDTVEKKKAVEIIKRGFEFCRDYRGEIPGATEAECGNYIDHSLEKANALAEEYLREIEAGGDNG